MQKAVKGFEMTGIWPFDDNKFGEDFAAADMTDECPAAAMPGGIESLSGIYIHS